MDAQSDLVRDDGRQQKQTHVGLKLVPYRSWSMVRVKSQECSANPEPYFNQQ